MSGESQVFLCPKCFQSSFYAKCANCENADLRARLEEATARADDMAFRNRLLRDRPDLGDRAKSVDALIKKLAAAEKARDEQAEAVRVLVDGVFGGQLARADMRRCPSTGSGAGGQTVGECLARMRFHSVPLSIFDHLATAEEAIEADAIAGPALQSRKERGA